MNIFYAPPAQISESSIELNGQEAKHASSTLRYKEGDKITVVDGKGAWYEGRVGRISPEKVWVEIEKKESQTRRQPFIIAAIGLIKKRDRLEFAVEKSIELGVAEIAIYRGEHSVKQNIRMDRLESIAVSAMKQSLQARLPKVNYFRSLSDLLENYSNCQIFTANKSGKKFGKFSIKSSKKLLLVIGPEGDFSKKELPLLKEKNTQFVSLGANRLRTETAAITFLNSFLFISKHH